MTKDKHSPISGPFDEFSDWMEEVTLLKIAERIDSIQIEYALAVIEGQEAGKEYFNAARNLRFLHDLRFQVDCLVEDTDRNKQNQADKR